jgi:hypothetical protein
LLRYRSTRRASPGLSSTSKTRIGSWLNSPPPRCHRCRRLRLLPAGPLPLGSES